MLHVQVIKLYQHIIRSCYQQNSMVLSPTEQPDPITLGQAMNVFIFVFKMYFLILFYFLVLGPVSSRTQQFLDFLIVKPKGYWVNFFNHIQGYFSFSWAARPNTLNILSIPFIFFLHLKKKLLSTCCGARTNMLVLIIM